MPDAAPVTRAVCPFNRWYVATAAPASLITDMPMRASSSSARTREPDPEVCGDRRAGRAARGTRGCRSGTAEALQEEARDALLHVVGHLDAAGLRADGARLHVGGQVGAARGASAQMSVDLGDNLRRQCVVHVLGE